MLVISIIVNNYYILANTKIEGLFVVWGKRQRNACRTSPSV